MRATMPPHFRDRFSVQGHAIVSADGMIADADFVLAECGLRPGGTRMIAAASGVTTTMWTRGVA